MSGANGDNLDCLVGLIEAWRREGDDLWKNSLMAAACEDETERVRLQDRSAILFRNANQLERLVQPNN